MLNRIIKFFLYNKLVTFLFLALLIAWGVAVAPFGWNVNFLPSDPVPVDAIPNYGENQQIVFTEWKGRSPQDIEDQISYPLTTYLLGVPGVKTIRSSSIFGFSSIYIIFDEDKEFYWTRSRILEKQNYSLSAHFPGRIENLRLNYTGEYVRKGQVIAILYSPELLTAQEELLQAYNDREMQPSLFEAAKEKLKNWKLNDAQIEKIIDLGRPREQFEIMADFSGYVTEKKVNEGEYVKQGQSLFQLNNFSKVWVVFDVYEQDIPFVELGSKVDFKIASFPNEEFSAKIDFINPTLSAQSRVAEARADIQNTDGKLKPEMLVSGQINYENQARSAVVIPKSAVMWTGKKSVVYVQEKTEKGISFVMREIDLGLPLNDEYVIESGLAEGEEIAVQGAFSIDAAAQLAGKPSMMSAERQDDFAVEISDEAQAELRTLYPSYFQLKEALTKDDFQSALARAKELKSVYQKIDMQAFQDDVHDKWMGYHAKMEKVLEHIHHHDDIESLRKNFIALSDWMIEMTETFSPTREKLYLQHCPMADNDQGADWLSMEEEIVNPYFGSSMLTCGEVEKVIN